MRILVCFLLALVVFADDEKKNKDDKNNNKNKGSPMPTFSVFPSAPPSFTPSPTAPPTSPPPTTEPTEAPTGLPTGPVPTSAPTAAPTIGPTSEPTIAPTGTPTAPPTMAPTQSPTVSSMPSISSAPTATFAPSANPTTTYQPSNAPTVPNEALPLPNYQFVMTKVGPVDGVAESIQEFMEDYLSQQYTDFLFVSADKETELFGNVVQVDFTMTMAHFELQSDDINMTDTNTTGTNTTEEDGRLFQQTGLPDPFDLANALDTRFTFFGSDRLMEHLQMDGFNITSIQSISSNGQVIGGDAASDDARSVNDSDDDGLNAYAISGIAIGASVLVIAGAIFALQRRRSAGSDDDDDEEEASSKIPPPPPIEKTNPDELAIQPTASASDSISAAAVVEPRSLDDNDAGPKYPQPYTTRPPYAKEALDDEEDEVDSVNYSTDGDIVSVTESLHAQDGPLFNVNKAVKGTTKGAAEPATIDPKSGQGSVRPSE